MWRTHRTRHGDAPAGTLGEAVAGTSRGGDLVRQVCTELICQSGAKVSPFRQKKSAPALPRRLDLPIWVRNAFHATEGTGVFSR